MKFTRNWRFERNLLTTLTISTTSLNAGEHDARYMPRGFLSVSRDFGKLDLEFDTVAFNVLCARREASTLFLASRQRARRRPFRYKFRWNSSLSHSARYQWWGTHLDWVFPLLFILFLRIVSHCVSLKEPISLPQPGTRPTMTTTRKTTTMAAATTTTTTKFHLIKFALYWSAHCGERSLSKSREIWRRLWAGALIRSDLLEQMNKRPFALEHSFLTRSRSLSTALPLPSDSLETCVRRSRFYFSRGSKLISILLWVTIIIV